MGNSIDLVGNTMQEIFTFETDQQLMQLEEILMAVENNEEFSTEEINEVFRIMHTIKGSSAMLDLSNISSLAHSAENLFNIIRENEINDIDYSLMCDIILNVSEFIKGEMIKIQENKELDGEPNSIISKIDDYISSSLTHINNDSTSTAMAKAHIEEFSSNHVDSNAFQIRVFFDEEGKMENMRAFQLVTNLKKKCENISYYPEDVDTNNQTIAYIQENGFEMNIETKLNKDEIEKLLNKASFMKSYDLWQINDEFTQLQKQEEIESLVIEAPIPQEEVIVETSKYYAKVFFDEDAKMENMRAFKLVQDIKKMGQVINHLPHELESEESLSIIRKNGFEVNFETTLNEEDVHKFLDKASFMTKYELATNDHKELELEVEVKDPIKKQKKIETKEYKNVNQSVISVNITKLDKVMDLIGEISVMQSVIINQQHSETQNEVYNAITRQLTKLTNELRDTVMSIRLLPVSIIFSNVNRIIRDMKRGLNKDVNFVVSGEETVLDKKIIDNLFDPIIHIVRNSMDHGIEDRATRIAMGKSEVGNITVSAESSGGYVTITITDDGKGIDKNKVLNKALSLGVVNKSVENMTDSEILSLIFESGLSTKSEVSEYSGRGVGMDIVRTKVEEMSGNVFVSSEVGVGTTFTIKVPLTLAILEGVKIQVGKSHFIVPSKMIEKTFKCSNDSIIQDTNNNEMVMLDHNLYPIIKLSQYLNIESELENYEDGIMILVREDKKNVCIFVDVILGEIESIIKPIPKYLLKYHVKENGISGCTKLENGDLCLILDVSRIISSVI